jgi:hypothetical protein
VLIICKLLVRMTEDGRKLETVRIACSPAVLQAVIARAGENSRVVVEGNTAGTKRRTCYRRPGRRCTLRIRWGTRRSATGESRMTSGTART